LEEPAVPAAAPCIARRALLAALGAGAVAAATCGCATGSGDSGSAAPFADVSPSGGARRLVSTTAVPVGGGKLLADILVVQPTAGQFRAFDARCPHMGAIVTVPQAGVITCYQHGSMFRAEDGARLSGPAERGLTELAITVDGTTILLNG
jgi:nitrite reductase/ring-hydroxylating ferredoxin subunit